MKIFTCFNTKGGVGKSLVLQQLVLPATALIYDKKVIYVDADISNFSSSRINKSDFIKEIIKYSINSEKDFAECIKFLGELLDKQEIILFDMAAASDARRSLKILHNYIEDLFIFVIDDVSQKDASADENTQICINLVKQLNIPCAIVKNKVTEMNINDDDYIIMPDLELVKEFIFNEKKTLYEIKPEDYNNRVNRAFARLCNTSFKSIIQEQIEKIRSFVCNEKI